MFNWGQVVEMEKLTAQPDTGTTVMVAEAVRTGRPPTFFPLSHHPEREVSLFSFSSRTHKKRTCPHTLGKC